MPDKPTEADTLQGKAMHLLDQALGFRVSKDRVEWLEQDEVTGEFSVRSLRPATGPEVQMYRYLTYQAEGSVRERDTVD